MADAGQEPHVMPQLARRALQTGSIMLQLQVMMQSQRVSVVSICEGEFGLQISFPFCPGEGLMFSALHVALCVSFDELHCVRTCA